MIRHFIKVGKQASQFEYRYLRKVCIYPFSSALDKQYDFQDILIMKRIQHPDQNEDQACQISQLSKVFQLHYKSQRLIFSTAITVLDFEYQLKTQIPDIHTVSTHVYTPKGEVQTSSSTPLTMVLKDDFILRFNNEEKYQVLTKVDDPPVIDLHNSYSLNQHSLHEHFQNIDQTKRTKVVLSDLVSRMFIEIGKTDKSTLDKSYILLLIKKVILKMGMFSQAEKQRIDQQISFLQLKEAKLQNIKATIVKELELKEQRQLQAIYAYLVAQIIFTQYGTYAVWGWGVMEPITFLIGVSDMIIAYIFWMRTTKSFNFENVLAVAVNKQMGQNLEESFDYREQLNDVQRMTEYLKFKRMIFSNNLDEVLDVVEGAIDGEKSKQQENDEDDN